MWLSRLRDGNFQAEDVPKSGRRVTFRSESLQELVKVESLLDVFMMDKRFFHRLEQLTAT